MWLKIYCLLCGYKHNVVRQTSERFQKFVRKNFAALIILMILWFFTGYLFTANHINWEFKFLPYIVGVVMMIIIIFIERQIILSDKGSKLISTARLGLGIVMAIIGSFVIDQALFKNDIENFKLLDPAFKERIEERKRFEIEEINNGIKFYLEKRSGDSLKLQKVENKDAYRSNQRAIYDHVVNTDGTIQSFPTEKSYDKFIDQQRLNDIRELKDSISSFDKKILILRSKESDVKKGSLSEAIKHSGFLEDLVYFNKFLWNKENRPALIFYSLVFFFLLFLELLILANKWGYKPTDYDALLEYQEKIIKDQFDKS